MASVEKHLAILDEAEEKLIAPLGLALTEAFVASLTQFRRRGQFPDISTALSEAVRALLASSYKDVAAGIMGLTEEDLGLKADYADQYLEDYVELFGRNSVFRIVRTSERRLIDEIAIGQRQGLSVEEITERLLESAPEIGRTRATVIARTETHAVSQYVSQRRAMASGYALQKRWNSVNDERTRDFGVSGRVSQFNHRVMNGARVPVDGKFLVPTLGGGFEQLLFPGDPNGSPGNIINCRCIQTYIRRA